MGECDGRVCEHGVELGEERICIVECVLVKVPLPSLLVERRIQRRGEAESLHVSCREVVLSERALDRQVRRHCPGRQREGLHYEGDTGEEGVRRWNQEAELGGRDGRKRVQAFALPKSVGRGQDTADVDLPSLRGRLRRRRIPYSHRIACYGDRQ